MRGQWLAPRIPGVQGLEPPVCEASRNLRPPLPRNTCCSTHTRASLSTIPYNHLALRRSDRQYCHPNSPSPAVFMPQARAPFAPTTGPRAVTPSSRRRCRCGVTSVAPRASGRRRDSSTRTAHRQIVQLLGRAGYRNSDDSRAVRSTPSRPTRPTNTFSARDFDGSNCSTMAPPIGPTLLRVRRGASYRFLPASGWNTVRNALRAAGW